MPIYTLSVRYTKNRIYYTHNFIKKRQWLSWLFISDSKTLTGKFVLPLPHDQNKIVSTDNLDDPMVWFSNLVALESPVKTQLLSPSLNIPACLRLSLRLCIPNKENILR